MTKAQLYQQLSSVNHFREVRTQFAKRLLDTTIPITHMLDIVFSVNDKKLCKAAWVLEFACREDITVLQPYLQTFLKHSPKVHLHAAVRPIAKICQYIVESNYSNAPQIQLTVPQQNALITLCFDWLIDSTQKVAPKAYAMKCLVLLGQNFNWVYPELKIIIQQNYQNQSAGYKASARHVLKAIGKRYN